MHPSELGHVSEHAWNGSYDSSNSVGYFVAESITVAVAATVASPSSVVEVVTVLSSAAVTVECCFCFGSRRTCVSLAPTELCEKTEWEEGNKVTMYLLLKALLF